MGQSTRPLPPTIESGRTRHWNAGVARRTWTANGRYTPFGRWLVRRLHAAGLTQEAAADRLGVSTRAIWGWQTGARIPSATSLIQLRRVLGCSGDELLDALEREE